MRLIRIIGLAFVGLLLLVGLSDAVYRWDVAGSERPTDAALIKTLVAHRAEFDRARCGYAGSNAVRDQLRDVGVKFASCDYDNTLRLGFDGSRLGLAIGPGWAKGLTHIPGEPSQHGTLVSSTDEAYRLNADVYLRPIGGGWFVWFQRDDD